MTLQTWGQKCFNSDTEPFEITDFDLGHPVITIKPKKKEEKGRGSREIVVTYAHMHVAKPFI